MKLNAKSCTSCTASSPAVESDTIASLLNEIPGWQVNQIDNVMQLSREFQFGDFKQALAFTLLVGDLAEHEGHHPEIVTTWGKVRINWWTHSIQGLHLNDFICAAKTDHLLQN
jgi:4a-hydroxytetrahydrobiopterin dehydratase